MDRNLTNFSCAPGHFAGHQFKYSATTLNATIGYIKYNAPQDTKKPLSDLPEWKALAGCCADARNVTKLEGDCSLWCSLPPAKFPPTSDDKKVLKDFSKCLEGPGGKLVVEGSGLARPQDYAVITGPKPTTTSSAGPSSQPTNGGAAATQKPGPNAGFGLGMPSLKSTGLLVLALGAFQLAV